MSLQEDYLGKKPKAKGINSKAKGQTNELNLAKWLTNWVGTEFVRVPASGGLRWQNSSRVIGDLIVTDPEAYFPFTIETKHLAALGLTKGYILRANSCVFRYWQQAKRDADRAGLIPSLWLRQNRMKASTWWLFIPEDLYQHLKPVLNGHVGVLHHGESDGQKLVGFSTDQLPAWKDLEILLKTFDNV